MPLSLVVIFQLCLSLCIISYAERNSWKNDLLALIKQTNSTYLCYYFRAKLSHKKKMSKENRIIQLNGILKECHLTNVSLSRPYEYPIAKKDRIDYNHIVMYTHNGFGNQLYQIAFGYLLASSMGRQFHIADTMPPFMYNPHHPDKLDPNSWSAYLAQREVLNFSRVDEKWVTDECHGSNITYTERRAGFNEYLSTHLPTNLATTYIYIYLSIYLATYLSLSIYMHLFISASLLTSFSLFHFLSFFCIFSFLLTALFSSCRTILNSFSSHLWS